MDRHTLALLIPVLALVIGLAATVLGGLIKLQKTRNENRQVGADDEIVARLEAVEQEVSSLRKQLSEADERIDFAERLLARPQPPPHP